MSERVINPVNVVCMKWGRLYGPEYVNILAASVRRNLTLPYRFVCFTDDPTGLAPGIEHVPLPASAVPHKPETAAWRKISPWRKVSLFSPEVATVVQGPCLFIDLDVIITGSLDEFFTHPGELCMIENWTQMGRGIGNSSVFRFVAGAHPEVFARYNADPDLLANSYDNEQIYVSLTLADKLVWWPAAWVRSFKMHCLARSWLGRLLHPPVLPQGAKIIAFPGSPNPPEAARQWLYGKKWYKPKFMRPGPWIREYWRI